MNDNPSPTFDSEDFNNNITKFENSLTNNQKVYFDAEQFVEIIEFYLNNFIDDKAWTALEYALEIHPGNTDILLLKARLFLEEEKKDEAKKVLYSISEVYKYEVKILKAELFLFDEKPEEAEKILQEISEDSEYQNPDFYFDAATLFMDMAYSDYALPWIKKAYRLNQDDEEVMMKLAQCLYDNEKETEAEDLFNKLIDKDPYFINYWYNLGRMYFINEKYEKALEAFNFAEVINAEDEKTILMTAHTYAKLGNHGEAARYYLKHTEVGRLPKMSFLFAGTSLFANQEYDKAKKAFQNFLQERTDLKFEDSDIYSNLASCYYTTGDYQMALRYITHAIKENTISSDTFFMKSILHLELGDIEAADESFITGIEINKIDNTEILIDLATTFYKAGLSDKAINVLKKLQIYSPGYGISYMLMAFIYLKMGNETKSTYYYNKAYNTNPESIVEFINEYINEEDSIVGEYYLDMLTKNKKNKTERN